MSNQGKALKEAFLQGTASLQLNKEYINELNVFPVPDGDTGTNMSMTLETAVVALQKLESDEIYDVCKTIIQGTLRGARGNSGVIMSQILRGIATYLQNLDKVTDKDICKAIVKSKESAYKAVIKPKEGTILTVVTALAKKANEVSNLNIPFVEKCEEIVKYGNEELNRTPEMLPILKEACVVDSGGKGLMCFAEGILSYLKGEKIEVSYDTNIKDNAINVDVEKDQSIEFGYCTEVMINNSKGFKKNAEKDLKKYLSSIGDSLVVVADENLIKIHVHTNHPGKVFEKALDYGYLTNLKVDNLKLEHQEKLIKDANKLADANIKKDVSKFKKIGFIVVSSGEGLKNIFKDLGVDYVIDGGQTMNPSTDDFILAIDKVDAKNIFIFPNNKNVILSAKQTKNLVKDKHIIVIETKNIIEGISCLAYYSPSENVKDVTNNFNENINNAKALEVTYSIRDTKIDDIEIKKNDYITISDSGILATDKNIQKSICNGIEKIITNEDTFVGIYYGEDVKEKDAIKLKNKIEKNYPNVEVQVYNGGQSVYFYYISIE